MKKYIFALLGILFLMVSCDKKEQEIAVASVSLNQPTAEMIIGETVQLEVSISPSNATDKTVLWGSSKQSVATVSKEGLVTAVAEGVSTITATVGGKSATCQVTVSKGVVEVTSISLNKGELALNKGQSETLVATIKPDDATDKTVSWSSSNDSIVTVDANGKVSAAAGGNATIVAKAGNQQATCTVTVTVPVESISLNRDSLTLEEESSFTLVATVKPDDANDKSVSWSSSDEQVATVDYNGEIKALKEGKTTIAAKAGEKTAKCEVIVNKKVIVVESITLDKTNITMLEDESTVLTATVKPDNATDKTISWSSSDTNVATVNEGRVSSIKEGKTIITAKAGEQSASCEVTVHKKVIAVESITLDKTSITIVEGESVLITATVQPDNATNKNVTWTSENISIATVEEGMIVGQSVGETYIYAISGDKTAMCHVIVERKVIPVSDIELNRTTLELTEGQSETLIATVYPDDATDKAVVWSSSINSIATVNDGYILAIAPGNTCIEARAGEKVARCQVTVNKMVVPVTGIMLNQHTLNLEKGDRAALTATIFPEDATDKTIKWASSEPSIVEVDEAGIITAIGAGMAIIKAECGGFDDVCHVNVIISTSSITMDQTAVSLEKGKSIQLYASVSPIDASESVIWKSSDPSVASVDDGLVTALEAGSTTIIASSGDKNASCDVTVFIPISSIIMSPDKMQMNIGDIMDIALRVIPSDATYDIIHWWSDDESIAKYEEGKVHALGKGSTNIFARIDSFEAFCSVSVIVPVTGVSLDITTAELKPSQTLQLNAIVVPDNASDKTVTWVSSEESVATVEQETGLVTAIHDGKTIISATTQSGGYKAICEITVNSTGTGWHEGTEEENWED